MGKLNNLQQLSEKVALASLGIGMLLVGGQQPLMASSPTAEQTLSASASAPRIYPYQSILNPDVPPLDDPSKFLPLGEQQAQLKLVLRLGERRVYVYRGESQIASYPVAVGKPGWETPTGTFQVTEKVENPQWENPWTGEVRPAGPNSALGLRWIGFWHDGKDAIGFHGTPTVNSIGQAASHGCVRMRNEDIVALFEKVEMGTVVMVLP